jgi:hypothetical protein
VEAARTHRAGSAPARLARAWRALPHESRLAAFASLGLFVTLFLPWYQVTLIASVRTAGLQSASATITGWGAFSFVEAAVLLVAAGVLTLLFQRAEGRAFHLPGGDGGVIMAAGLWTCVLVVWRIFDKQGATANGPSATSSGVEWGIFIALAAAAFLAYSGSRIRAAHRPEPPLPGEDRAPEGSSAAATVVLPPRGEAPTRGDAPTRERPRRRARPPMPVPAEPPDPSDLPTRSDRPLWAGDPAAPTDAPPSDATPSGTPADRPRRRRPSASELFERVVPEDPPTMPFGRAKRSDIKPPDGDPTEPRATAPEPPPPTDEQLTIPFADRTSEDETLPLATDRRSRASEDATARLGEDPTQTLGQDATQRLGEDDTLPLDR